MTTTTTIPAYAVLINGDYDYTLTADAIRAAHRAGLCRGLCSYDDRPGSLVILAGGESDWDLRGHTYQMGEATWTVPVESEASALRLAAIDL